MPINIAIDGPSAAGKSTIAKRLAKKYNYIHLDTGAMYRACALESINKKVEQDDPDQISEMMDNIQITFNDEGNILLDGKDVSKEIRKNKISMHASCISAIPIVREKLVALQQSIAKNKGYILDGRDIGTVVLKDAEVKIFMIASVEARAKRRYNEYIQKNEVVDYDVIAQDIEQRDYQDMHRKVSPLKKADDAIEVDTSNMSIDEVVDAISKIIESKIKKEEL